MQLVVKRCEYDVKWHHRLLVKTVRQHIVRMLVETPRLMLVETPRQHKGRMLQIYLKIERSHLLIMDAVHKELMCPKFIHRLILELLLNLPKNLIILFYVILH